MDRMRFLKSHWKAYPDSTCWTKAYTMGRLQAGPQDALVFCPQGSKPHPPRVLTVRPQAQNPEPKAQGSRAGGAKGGFGPAGNPPWVKDPELGPSCPISCLRAGDWVAWCGSRQVFFLLAPCLGEAPAVPPETMKMEDWVGFLDQIRHHFKEKGFQEILTPYLVPSPGVDHHIDFMRVKGVHTGREWSLPTSPEIHLKKYLCQGYEKIFEIKSCFRDDLPSPWHQSEFTMIEWYRAFASLRDMAQDLEQLFCRLNPQMPPFQNITMAELFKQRLGVKLSPHTSLGDLQNWADQQGVEWSPTDDWNDLFFRLFMEKLEKPLGLGETSWGGETSWRKGGLGHTAPLLVWNFPPQQASLAKIGPDGWTQRFELYWKGVELANAYLEVNNPQENRERFEKEGGKRASSQRTKAPLDENFFQWMDHGMPPSSGLALGLNRLFELI